MNKVYKSFLLISIRYLFLVILVLPGLILFYRLFSPLTIYPVYFLLNIFFDATLTGTTIFVQEFPIEIVEACIAGAAYYLLLIFNLSIPGIKVKKRISMVLFAFITFLLVNILRIFLLSILYISGSRWFDFAHELFWYAISIVFVVGIWFLEVKLFKLKSIPFYSDLNFLYSHSYLKK